MERDKSGLKCLLSCFFASPNSGHAIKLCHFGCFALQTIRCMFFSGVHGLLLRECVTLSSKLRDADKKEVGPLPGLIL